MCVNYDRMCAFVFGYLYPFPKGSYDEPKPFEHTHEEDPADIDAFPLDEAVLPDGSTVSKYDAIYGNENVLAFDFGFYEIAPPVSGTSFDDPDIIKYDDDGKPEFNIDPSEFIGEHETDLRKVAKGDVLENGLIVDHACCYIRADGEFQNGYILFKGEITLTGYLAYEFHPERQPSETNGALWFIPDTSSGNVPTCYYPPHSPASVYRGDWMSKDPYVLYSGSIPWKLGNTKSKQYAEFDLETLFDGKSYTAVNVTVRDPIFGEQYGGYFWYSESGIYEPSELYYMRPSGHYS